MKKSLPVIMAVAALFVAAYIRWPQILYGLPAARTPDSVKTVEPARRLADDWKSGRWNVDPGVYQYPTLYTNVLAVTYLFVPSSWDSEGVARALAVLFCLLALFPAYALGNSLGGERAGLLAAMLVAFGFVFVVQGRTPGPDTLQLLLAALAFATLLRDRRPSMRDVALAGFLTGLAVGTKYTALIFVAPAVIFCGDTPKKVALGIGACMVGFLAGTPAFVTHHKDFIDRFLIEKSIQQSGGFSFGGPGLFGYLYRSGIQSTEVPFQNTLVYFLGWPLVIAGIAAFVWLGWRAVDSRDRRFAGIAAAMAVSYFFFALTSKIQAIRFILIFIWLGMVATALFIDWISAGLNRPKAGIVVGILLLAPSFLSTIDYLQAMLKPDTRMTSVMWMLSHVPRGDRVLNMMYGPALPKGYDMAVWTMPEYNVQLDQPWEAPTFERLKKENLRWVIWNSFYARKFFEKPNNPKESAYYECWRHFYRDINERGKKMFTDEGWLSPNIEIYRVAQ